MTYKKHELLTLCEHLRSPPSSPLAVVGEVRVAHHFNFPCCVVFCVFYSSSPCVVCCHCLWIVHVWLIVGFQNRLLIIYENCKKYNLIFKIGEIVILKIFRITNSQRIPLKWKHAILFVRILFLAWGTQNKLRSFVFACIKKVNIKCNTRIMFMKWPLLGKLNINNQSIGKPNNI